MPARPHLDEIIDAAELVISEKGMGRLTLDAVAARAGLSKAGLLHHFPSKDALVDAMVMRHTSIWHGQFRAAYERLRDAGDPRPAVGAMMSTCLAGTHAWTENERARNRVMVAALVHDERRVEPLRRVCREIAALLSQDQLNPGAADVIHLAVHGLWFEWIFGMGEISSVRLKAVREALASIGGFGLSPTPSRAGGARRAASGTKAASSRKRGVR